MEPQAIAVQPFPEVVASLFSFDGDPIYTGKTKDGNWDSYDWSIRLKRSDGAGSVLTIPYHCGMAYASRVWFQSQGQYSMRIGQWVTKERKDITGNLARCYVESGPNPAYITGVYDLKVRDGGNFLDLPQPPKIEDVVYSVFSDVQGYEQSPTFPQWADDYGYNLDSIRALETFQAVQREALDWYRCFHLTPAEIERLADAMQDY